MYKIGEYEASRQAYSHALRLDTNNTWRDHINKALQLLPPSISNTSAPQAPPQAPPMHRQYPSQQPPLHPQQPRAPYTNIPPRAQTQYMPQYPGYAYHQQGNNGAQDRRRAPDAEGCILQ